MLNLPTWEPSMSVGNNELDEQHARLLALAHRAAELEYLADSSAVRQQIVGVLSDIGDLAREHYAAEERILARNGFPDLVSHQSQHQAHLEVLTQLLHEVRRQGVYRAGFTRGVTDYVYYHVIRADMGCKAFLK